MRFLNKTIQKYKSDREQIAYLASLTLLFSYAELILPRVIPFFRLGLSNIAILASFNLSFPSFFMLTVLKAIASSLTAGTLFSPFFAISLCQSVCSGILMFALFRMNRLCKDRLFSIYGISISGSCASGAIQIILASLYLGRGTFSLLGPVLIFNTISGIITAVLAQILNIKTESSGVLGAKPLGEGVAEKSRSEPDGRFSFHLASDAEFEARGRLSPFLFISAIIILSVATFLVRSIPVLTGFLAFSLLLQVICKRKIRILPHISLWIFILLCTIFVPSGKVFFKIGNFSFTQGALILGIEKALKLSAVSALSQTAASIKLPQSNILGLTLAFYRTLLDKMQNSSGNVFKRLKNAIKISEPSSK